MYVYIYIYIYTYIYKQKWKSNKINTYNTHTLCFMSAILRWYSTIFYNILQFISIELYLVDEYHLVIVET